ncbi:hypothetical protein KM043_003036 [Ampulex compressa]|nr:hypothetical protein KM043_003036 [Ampulex compressa]
MLGGQRPDQPRSTLDFPEFNGRIFQGQCLDRSRQYPRGSAERNIDERPTRPEEERPVPRLESFESSKTRSSNVRPKPKAVGIDFAPGIRSRTDALLLSMYAESRVEEKISRESGDGEKFGSYPFSMSPSRHPRDVARYPGDA